MVGKLGNKEIEKLSAFFFGTQLLPFLGASFPAIPSTRISF